ncbi:MAG: YdcF family protein, partial [Acidimicrobiaceae bacterium]
MKLRRVFQSLGVSVLIAAAYFFVSLLQVWNTGRSADRQPVDAILVLGAAQYDGRPSPQLQARLDHALELWNLNLASYIVVTGGKQEGDRFTEAATSRKFFESSGVA